VSLAVVEVSGMMYAKKCRSAAREIALRLGKKFHFSPIEYAKNLTDEVVSLHEL